MKQPQLNGQQVEKSDEQIKSEKRTHILATKVFDAIKEAAEEVEEDFTAYEMNDVFLKMAHRYNHIGLAEQYKKE